MTRFRARADRGWAWLTAGALTLGFGIWGMHTIVMLGFAVDGMTVRHTVFPMVLTGLLSLGSVGLGLYLIGACPNRVGFLVAGTGTGLGLVGMHCISMAAVEAPAEFSYSSAMVTVVAVVLATAAATAMIWVAATVKGRIAAIGCSLLTAALLWVTQYIALTSVDVTPTDEVAGHGAGKEGIYFIVPLIVALGTVMLAVVSALCLTPVHDAPSRLFGRDADVIVAPVPGYGSVDRVAEASDSAALQADKPA
ncbi:MHYT domain-containing protein [Actinacidiphila glaucinigra]|uniref:MHYT domain-containing protein n=1 Tax=Actinacidiphila glaucinigra TaxID=235986 RepID=UPI003D9287ED